MKENYLKEVELPYTFATCMEEAERCLLCYDAPCTQSCPAGTDPGKFIRSVRFHNYKGAAETIRTNNPLGGICARVCPTEKYCELACSRCGIDKPINIGKIQRFVTDLEDKLNMKILQVNGKKNKKIALIGSGPGNLSCATRLLELGYDVDIYEEKEKLGGYLRYGIPEYRLPEKIVDSEIQKILDLGLKPYVNTKIGVDKTLKDLEENYEAIVIGIGFSKSKTLPMFEDNKFTITATNFLEKVKKRKGNIDIPKNVVVIGGGDVAMDVSTTLKKLGVPYVTDVIYEEAKDFVASKEELAYAKDMGVTLIDGYVPTKIEGRKISFKHRLINANMEMEVDQVILAIGQKIDDTLNINLTENNLDSDGLHIKNSKYFVVGDIAKGDKTVVWAVEKGKKAALLIDDYLGGENID